MNPNTNIEPAGVAAPASCSAIRDQVIQQCKAVAHMAAAIAKTHEGLAEILAHAKNDAPIIEVLGESTTERMEMLGELCNAMDIVEDQDAWISPVMVEARRLWRNAPGMARRPNNGGQPESQEDPES